MGNHLNIYFEGARFFWKSYLIFDSIFYRHKHPVQSSQVVDTAISGLQVIIVPTMLDNYSFIVTDGKDAVIIDPSEEPPLAAEIVAKELQVTNILISHDDPDHVAAVMRLKHRFGGRIVAAAKTRIPVIEQSVKDGDVVKVCGIDFRVMVVPGHSPNHVAWYSESARILFTGDTLFSCGYGMVGKDGPEQMFKSLQRIRQLPDDTLMLCGHEYTLRNTTFACQLEPHNNELKERFSYVQECLKNKKPTIPTLLSQEKRWNPFLRWDDASLIAALGMANLPALEAFLRIRQLKNEFNKTN